MGVRTEPEQGSRAGRLLRRPDVGSEQRGLEGGLRSPGPEAGPAGRAQALVTCFLSLGSPALVWLFLPLGRGRL